MGSYVGKHAQYYDVFYADKPYAAEAAIVHQLFREHSHGSCESLLELACGTGRHALELEKLGYRIVATDYSKDLLAVAREKAISARSRVDFRFQDMRSLDLSGEVFDGAYCLFDSIGYVQTNESINKVLQSVRSHLRPEGLFIFEFWHAAAMLRNFDPRRERRWPIPGGELHRISTTKLNVVAQTAEVSYEIEEFGDHQSVSKLGEVQTNRFFLVQEMAEFLEVNGFQPIKFLPAYEINESIDENTWHILAVARRS